MTANPPEGTVTFLFSDIEGSTRLWEQHPEAMRTALARHDGILRQAIEEQGGHIIKSTGDGIHAAFGTALAGLAAALNAQLSFYTERWDELKPQVLRVRMGLHTGEAQVRAGDYYGTALNRAARLMSIGHGGQILLSHTTADLVRDQLPPGAGLRDLGEHRLKDLVRPEQVFQVTRADLPSDFPALHSLDAFPNNLPVQLTSFIGREHELQEARQRLASSRLLTLIGPGGTGKTRLSLQLGAELVPAFADGVWLAELAPLTDPALVLRTVGSVFGLREQLGMPLSELLLDFLRAKELLLLIDNCEHLVEACAQLADQLLRACPKLKIITSSREALGISGEAVYRVPSLSLPDLEHVTQEALTRCESAQLFIERASAASPNFSLSENNAAAIAQICKRLDGIPLALELAAARVPFFSPEQIAVRLDDRFRLLTGGSRTALPRQQTLRALIDWSYEMLAEPERTLLRRLSVFAGGWTFEAAEAVCAELDVLGLLTQLVNKSLVTVDEESIPRRYRLLETVRQYARDKLLEAGESEQARQAHFEFFHELVRQAEPKLDTLQALEWINRLEAEYDNIRAAFAWGLDNRLEEVLDMIARLPYFWNRRGYEEEAGQLISEALKRAEKLPKLDGEAGHPHLRNLGAAWQSQAMLAYSHGDEGRGIKFSEQAVSLARQAGDQRLLAMALAFQGLGMLFVGKFEGSEALFEESLAAARGSGDQHTEVLSQTLYEVALAVQQGDSRIADAHLDKSFALLQENEQRWEATMVILNLGIIAKSQADYAEARKCFAACEPLFRELGDRHRLNMVQSELAHIERYEGNYAQAESMYRETIREWGRIGHRAAIAHQLECFAAIAKVQERRERAAKLFGAAQVLRERIGIPMTPRESTEYEREIAELRAAMPETLFAAQWAEGHALPMEKAIQFALERLG